MTTISAIQIGPLVEAAAAQTNLAPEPGVATLVVNVASKCGRTPQHAGLERLQERFAGRGFTGVPCNQFAGQEQGSSEQIAEFCSATGLACRSPRRWT